MKKLNKIVTLEHYFLIPGIAGVIIGFIPVKSGTSGEKSHN